MASVFDPSAQHEDVDSKIAAGLERLSQVLRLLLRERAQAFGLSSIQLQFLVHLCHHRTDRQVSALGRVFELTKATVSDAVRTLEAKGYLERLASSEDRRVTVLEPTEAGRQLCRELEGWADPLREQLRDLPPSARLDLMKTLMDLIGALQAKGVIGVVRMCQSCRFFRPGVQGSGAPHHCALLERPLAESELRLDCPEHQPLPA